MEGRSKVVADAQLGIKPSREVRVAQFGPQWPHYGEVRIPDIAAPKCLSLEKTIQVFAMDREVNVPVEVIFGREGVM